MLLQPPYIWLYQNLKFIFFLKNSKDLILKRQLPRQTRAYALAINTLQSKPKIIATAINTIASNHLHHASRWFQRLLDHRRSLASYATARTACCI